MGFEIDFLAVGDESRGGDAIAIRYGNLKSDPPDQKVIVIDGGYNKNGRALVRLIKDHYHSDHIDAVVSTHPDQDHSSGLEVVLERMEVGVLLMHLPWKHSRSLSEAKSASFRSFASVGTLEASLNQVTRLEEIATRKGIPIIEPFEGFLSDDGCFRILGPSKDYYEELLPKIVEASSRGITTRLMERVLRKIGETFHIETLRDDGVTTQGNNSSVISLLNVEGYQFLFTGDGGIPALERVLNVLESEGFKPGEFRYVQIPHHGSRHNIGPSVLNRMLGPKGQDKPHSKAFVSIPKDNTEHKHPSKKVTNAYLRRGYEVYKTGGTNLRQPHNAPDRPGYSPAEPLPFYDQVEDDS